MKILMFFVIFLLFGMFFIISNENILLSEVEDRGEAGRGMWMVCWVGRGLGAAARLQ